MDSKFFLFEEILATLSQQLTWEYRNVFYNSALSRKVHSPKVFEDLQIVATLSRQLGRGQLVENIFGNHKEHREHKESTIGLLKNHFSEFFALFAVNFIEVFCP